MPFQVLVALALLGAYYAMTDGVLTALASGLVPDDVRATGLGLVASATGVARLVASIIFGIVWTVLGIQAALIVFLVGLVVAFAIAGMALAAFRAHAGKP